MKAVMMDGYFKGEEVEIATAVPRYKFMLPKRNDGFMSEELTFESLAKYKPTVVIYKPAIVTKSTAYYKFSHNE